MEQSLIDKFLKELSAHISLLERDYESRKKLYDVDRFLRKNFSSNDTDVYTALVNLANARCKERGEALSEQNTFESVAVECYELLKFFEPNTSITLDELKEAFFTCSLANKNEVMKKYDRYKNAVNLLNTLKQLFIRHQFRKAENNSVAIDSAKAQMDKFSNLYKFLTTGELDTELENVDTYYIRNAHISEEEWLEIYNHILLMRIKAYKKVEDKKFEDAKAIIDAEISSKAREIESKIKEQVPEESADLFKPVVEPVQVVEEVPALVEVEQPKEELTSIQDEEVLEKFSRYEMKMSQYRKFGKISLTKSESFNNLYESLSLGNSLDNIRPVFTSRDYLKFLYFCFVKEVNKIKVDLETLYPVSEIDEFTELLKADMDNPLAFLNELEVLLIQEKKEQMELNGEDPVPTEETEEKPFKLVFYGKKDSADILKDIKKFTPEKMQDLIDILTKIEEGKIDRYMVINKNVPVLFRSIRGDYVFVAFRVLSDGHILIVTASNLDELSSNLYRLSNYDSDIEDDISRIIRDGSYEYTRLMKESEDTKKIIYGSGFGKGV